MFLLRVSTVTKTLKKWVITREWPVVMRVHGVVVFYVDGDDLVAWPQTADYLGCLNEVAFLEEAWVNLRLRILSLEQHIGMTQILKCVLVYCIFE